MRRGGAFEGKTYCKRSSPSDGGEDQIEQPRAAGSVAEGLNGGFNCLCPLGPKARLCIAVEFSRDGRIADRVFGVTLRLCVSRNQLPSVRQCQRDAGNAPLRKGRVKASVLGNDHRLTQTNQRDTYSVTVEYL